MELNRHRVDSWLKEAGRKNIISPDGILSDRLWEIPHACDFLFPDSVQRVNGVTYALLRTQGENVLGVFGHDISGKRFDGVRVETASTHLRFCPLTHENAEALRTVLPFTAPTALSDQDVTFGVGDRLGIAGPGHVRLFKRYRAAPVFSQQSVREVGLTQRTYENVLDSSTWAVFQEGFAGPWGADGDHLKTTGWVKKTLSIGFTMITADVSDFIRQAFSVKTDAEVISAYMNLDSSYRGRIEEEYLQRSVDLDTGQGIRFSRDDLVRAGLMYGEAIAHAGELYRAGVEVRGEGNFDFELSVDETDTPTTPQAHIFVAKEAQRLGVKITSLAPRFVGDFQKGIDFIGDRGDFERSLRIHAAIARKLGYRISVHSGSDKFSIFPVVGQSTGGMYHVKTSGTNWLVALKVISECEPNLFRALYNCAQNAFAEAKTHYHVTARLENIPRLSTFPDSQLTNTLLHPDARQVLHITYGQMLADPHFKTEIYNVLKFNIESYWRELDQHIGKHLELLGVDKKDPL
jgi:hypothetical protein